MRIKKEYKKNLFGQIVRKNTEKKLFNLGYKVIEEREFEARDWNSTCCLAIIFLPLAFFAIGTKVEVTYEK